jgi:O-antigen ligase
MQGVPWSAACLILAVVAFVAEGARMRSRTIMNASLLAFAAVAIVSGVTAAFPSESFRQLPILGNWVVAYILIANTATTERRWFVFIALYLLWSLKMSQHGFISWATRGFSFASWGVSGSPGWFQNSGEFALQMGMFVPLSIYFISAVKPFVSKNVGLALWALPVTGVSSIIASSSRGGQLALVVVALAAVIRSEKRFRNIAFLVVVAPLLWLITPSEQKARFQTAGDDATSQLRITYWKRGVEMANERPVLGIGYGNWVPVYKQRYYVPGDTLNRFDRRGELKVELAHNSFVEILSQMGYLGLVIFVWLLCSIFVVNTRTRRMLKAVGPRGRFLSLMTRGMDDGVIAFAVAGYFMSVALYPFVWFQLAMTAALHAAAKQLVDTYGAEKVEATGQQPSDGVPLRSRRMPYGRRSASGTSRQAPLLGFPLSQRSNLPRTQ